MTRMHVLSASCATTDRCTGPVRWTSTWSQRWGDGRPTAASSRPRWKTVAAPAPVCHRRGIGSRAGCLSLEASVKTPPGRTSLAHRLGTLAPLHVRTRQGRVQGVARLTGRLEAADPVRPSSRAFARWPRHAGPRPHAPLPCGRLSYGSCSGSVAPRPGRGATMTIACAIGHLPARTHSGTKSRDTPRRCGTGAPIRLPHVCPAGTGLPGSHELSKG